MSEAEAILAHQTKWADHHITVRFLGFDPSTGMARLAVDEKHANAASYDISVSFGSGDSKRIRFDGTNNRPTVTSDHKNDVVTGIKAQRVRD